MRHVLILGALISDSIYVGQVMAGIGSVGCGFRDKGSIYRRCVTVSTVTTPPVNGAGEISRADARLTNRFLRLFAARPPRPH